MKILLNNRAETFDNENLTIEDLLTIKNYTFKMLVIKINNQLVKKEQYSSTHINDGDKVDILHLISGG